MRLTSAGGCRKMTKSNRSGLSFTSCSSVTYILMCIEKRLNLIFHSSFRDTWEFCLNCWGFFSHPNTKFCYYRNKINVLVYAILDGIFMKSVDSVILKYTGRMKYLIRIIYGFCIWNAGSTFGRTT